jgi:hypothetical protein
MKFDAKLNKISKKSQMRMDKVSIILGISLLIASCCSYVVIEAFGQSLELDCPKNAYHGLDNQGNETCRDILTNQILEPESQIIIDSEKTKSDFGIINDPKTGSITLNGEQPQIIEIIIVALIGIIGGIIGLSAKKGKLKIFQRQNWSIPRLGWSIPRLGWSIPRLGWSIPRLGWSIPRLGWSSIQKEQVRNRQYGKCNMCFTEPSRWKYDHINGNKRNNDLNNCQGLCSHCYSVKTEKENLVNI